MLLQCSERYACPTCYIAKRDTSPGAGGGKFESRVDDTVANRSRSFRHIPSLSSGLTPTFGPSFDGGDDLVWVGFPDERLWGLVVLLDEAVHGRLEIDEGVEDAVFEPSAGELGGEAFDGIQP